MDSPAHPVSSVENTLGGCLVQLLALPAAAVAFGLTWLVFGHMDTWWMAAGGVAIGAAVGTLLIGRRYATVWKCSWCRNNLSGPAVRVCPTCHAGLGNAWK